MWLDTVVPWFWRVACICFDVYLGSFSTCQSQLLSSLGQFVSLWPHQRMLRMVTWVEENAMDGKIWAITVTGTSRCLEIDFSLLPWPQTVFAWQTIQYIYYLSDTYGPKKPIVSSTDGLTCKLRALFKNSVVCGVGHHFSKMTWQKGVKI